MATAITATLALITLLSLVNVDTRWMGMMGLALLSWVLDPISFTALLALAGVALHINQDH